MALEAFIGECATGVAPQASSIRYGGVDSFPRSFFVADLMDALSSWLEAHSSSLRCVRGEADHVRFCCSKARSVVTINAAQSYHCKLSALLHECGHIIIYRRRCRNRRSRVCGASYRDFWLGSGRLKRATQKRKLNILHEEICAWELGEALARKLNIRVRFKVFER